MSWEFQGTAPMPPPPPRNKPLRRPWGEGYLKFPWQWVSPGSPKPTIRLAQLVGSTIPSRLDHPKGHFVVCFFSLLGYRFFGGKINTHTVLFFWWDFCCRHVYCYNIISQFCRVTCLLLVDMISLHNFSSKTTLTTPHCSILEDYIQYVIWYVIYAYWILYETVQQIWQGESVETWLMIETAPAGTFKVSVEHLRPKLG